MIRRMVRDLDLPVEIVACPIVRERDGLAMSSRNAYLDPQQRQALVLSRSLMAVQELIHLGARKVPALIEVGKKASRRNRRRGSITWRSSIRTDARSG